MGDRYIVDDIDEGRSLVLKNKFKVFTLLQTDNDKNNHSYNKYLHASLVSYHTHLKSKNFENIIRAEGIELYFDNTDFGLKEIIITKIK